MNYIITILVLLILAGSFWFYDNLLWQALLFIGGIVLLFILIKDPKK
jgi:hypothetical protein